MKLIMERKQDNGVSTLGILSVDHIDVVTIEDTFRTEKVFGKTRIPAGTYEIKLRTVGGHHERYKKNYSFHKGMLWLQDVPNFKYILIHIGNTAEDSHGCIIVGTKVVNDNYISGSKEAYVRLYKHVVQAFERKEKVIIEIKDN